MTTVSSGATDPDLPDKPAGLRLAELLRDGARCDRSGPRWKEALAFHEQNPWVYDRLRDICYQLRAKGFGRYSTRTIIAVLRFEWDLKTTHQEVPIAGGETAQVKLNDHHTAYYARMLIEEHPTMFWDFLELRAAEGDPTELPPRPSPKPAPRAPMIGTDGQLALW